MTTLFEPEVPAAPAAGPRPNLIDPRCPSEAGYQAHQKRGEKPCDGCREARNATRRAREAAKPKPPPRPDRTLERFWSKVDDGDYTECWQWTATRNAWGYGRFSIGGRQGHMAEAHRVAYQMLIDEIPEGLELDHRARQLAITHCPRGHAYDAENTAYRPDGRRRCKACGREDQRRRYENAPAKYREIARQYRTKQRSAAA